jgi:peptidoglycan/LPS O-acetylase OafA/YrhL
MRTMNNVAKDLGMTKRALVALIGLAIGFLSAIFVMATQSLTTVNGNAILIGILASCVLFICAGEPSKKR